MLDKATIRELFCKEEGHFAGVEHGLSGFGDLIYAEEDGVLIKFKGTDIYTVYGCDGRSAAKVVSLIPDKPGAVVCSRREEVVAAKERFPFITRSKACWQVRYLSTCGAPVPEDTVVARLEATDENVDFVTSTYSLGYPRKEIERLVGEVGVYGAYTGGKLSGYIGSHDEGTIGLLEVMPEFRRRGLGLYLLDYMVGRFIAEGRVAYSQIVYGNVKSYNMHIKAGFKPAEKLIYWCF